ncbi:hypothetical protein BGX38DRAFT_1266888 [Terfezia claveryi]|nr:hypothetical protein BGX38DRAFT_1266888 [Terfezia claveryi]
MSDSLHAPDGVSLSPSGSLTPESEYSRSHAGSLYSSEDEAGVGHQSGSRVDVEHVETCKIRRRYTKITPLELHSRLTEAVTNEY